MVVAALLLLVAAYGVKADTLNAIYTTGREVPLTAAGYTATGNTVSFTLNYAPSPGAVLMVIANTSTTFIQGSFSNLSQGQQLFLTYGGNTYSFVANYYGGPNGRDLVLRWASASLASWGGNPDGELANETTVSVGLPSAVPSAGPFYDEASIIAIATGYDDGFALLPYELAAWGNGVHGQLGDSSYIGSATPVTVYSSAFNYKTLVEVAAGAMHNLAVCSDGTVATWGYNADGELGNGATSDSDVPVFVALSKSAIAVAGGQRHSLALCSDGTVAAWGYGVDGELGNGAFSSATSPVFVSISGTALTGKTVVAITAGAGHSLALCSDGTVVAWGYNADGELGNNSFSNSDAPAAVDTNGTALTGKTVIAIAAGAVHSLALCSDGTVAAWGYNADGELGNDSNSDSSVPVPVATAGTALQGKFVTAIAAGAYHSLALCSDGSLVAWGNNATGCLGNGGTVSSNVPVAVTTTGTPLAGAGGIQLAAGDGFSFALVGTLPGIISVAEPAGATLTNGSSTVSFGGVDLGQSISQTYTVTNTGPSTLSGLEAYVDGTNADQFYVDEDQFFDTTLAPGASTTFTVQFTPNNAGPATATLYVDSFAPGPIPFTATLNGTGSNTFTAAFNTPSDTPLITDDNFTATGITLAPVTLGFQPTPGMTLTLVSNQGGTPISGTFTNVPDGGTVTIDYNGTSYVLTAYYEGNDGFDLVLVFPSAEAEALDYGFGSDGRVLTAIGVNGTSAAGVAVQADDRIVTVGSCYDGNSYSFAIARYNKDGGLDSSFGSSGIVTTSFGTSSAYASGVAIQPDGSIVVVGSAQPGGFAAARYTPSGTLDPTFNGTGMATFAVGTNANNEVATGVALQSDGKIVIVGQAQDNYGDTDFAVIRLTPAGVLDANFGASGVTLTKIGQNLGDYASCVAIQADGKIVVGGSGGLGYGEIARYNTNGSLDGTFNEFGFVTTENVPNEMSAAFSSIAVQSDGMIVVGGVISTSNPIVNGIAACRYSSAGAPDPTFGSLGQAISGIGAQNFAPGGADGMYKGYGVVIQPDGKIAVAGLANPTPSSSNPEQGIGVVRFTSDGQPDATFAGQGGFVVPNQRYQGSAAAIQSNGMIIVAGTSSTFNGQFFNLVRIETGITPDISVQQPAGAVLTNSASTVNCGTALVGTPVSTVITIENAGFAELTGLAVTVDGPDAVEFTAGALGAVNLEPGDSTTFTVVFQPAAGGTRTAAFHVFGNVTGGNSPFNVALSGTGSTSFSPTLSTATTIPLTVSGLNLTGITLAPIAVDFLPTPGMIITLLQNTGVGAISGTFAGLPEGGTAQVLYNGVSYGVAAVNYGSNVTATLLPPQTVSFSPVGTRSVGDAPIPLEASSVPGATVNYLYVSGDASVQGSSVMVTGGGPVTVEAELNASGYEPAVVTQTFQVLDGTASFQGVGSLSGGNMSSSISGVSNGGIEVAGASNDGSAESVYWSRKADQSGNPVITLNSLQNGSPSITASANAVSAYGSTVVGAGNNGGCEPYICTLPVSPQGSVAITYIESLPQGYVSGSAQAVSADGSVVAGLFSTASVPGAGVAGAQAFRWTQSGGAVSLGSITGSGSTRADGISADGSAIVGSSTSPSGGTSTEACIWTTSLAFPQALGGQNSAALAISGDATAIVGNALNALNGHQQACFWHQGDSAPTFLQELANATGSGALAVAVCGNGAIMTGYSTVAGAQIATIWQLSDGVYMPLAVADALATQYTLDSASGATLAGWTLTQATAISQDGFAIAGNGIDPTGNQEGWLAIVPRASVFNFSSPTYSANEGDPSVTLIVEKSPGFRGDVNVSLTPGTAILAMNGVGDYLSPSNPTLSFDTDQASETITIPLNFDGAPTVGGVRTFQVTLASATTLATISNGTAMVTINALANDADGPQNPDGGPIRVLPNPPPETGSLQVILDGPPGALWRFAGDTDSDWMSSRATFPGLQSGNYVIEFSSVVDFGASPPMLAPGPAPATVFVQAGTPTVITVPYPPGASASPAAQGQTSTELGSLQVVIYPSSVANNVIPAQRGQWRFFEETDGQGNPVWRDSGATILNLLPPGSYQIQFSNVPGFDQIPSRGVPVQVGTPTVVNVTYEAEGTVYPQAGLPKTLSLSQVTSQEPYEFVGQLSSDLGYGSGTVVANAVVLTAAHVVYDPVQMGFATSVQWRFEEFASNGNGSAQEAMPLTPRGAILFSGYGAYANADAENNTGASPEAQELDAAALYFATPAGNGAASGYLVSGGTGADWLLKGRLATLAGYPVDAEQTGDSVTFGEMQATAPAVLAITESAVIGEGDLYTTSTIAGLQGMSGGPFCVQYDDGNYYPAAIDLGTNAQQQTVFRRIDSAVAGLIETAAAIARNGSNTVGGGQIQVSSSLVSGTFEVANVTVNFSPSFNGASWHFSTESAETQHTTGQKISPNISVATNVTIEFAAVFGRIAPPNYTVTLVPGQSLILTAEYLAPHAPEFITSKLPYAGEGLQYPATTIESAYGPSRFMVTSVTDPFGVEVAGNNLGALGLALSAGGVLSGMTASGAGVVTGTYSVTVEATNSYKLSNTRTFELVVEPAAQLTVNFDPTMGTVGSSLGKVISGVTTMVPQTESVTVTATRASVEYVFDSWTIAGMSQPVSYDNPYTFSMPGSLNLTANFIANPFPSAPVTYNGLFTDNLDLANGAGGRGMASLTLTPLGSFSGFLYFGARRLAVHGQFDGEGSWQTAIKGSSVTLNLQLDLPGSSQTAILGSNPPLRGTATVANDTLQLVANPTRYTVASPAPQALGAKTYARYTLALPHPAGVGLPQGDGFGTVTVTPTGSIHFAGSLGDGTAVSEGTGLGPNGEWPFFALLYENTGVVTGPLVITAAGANGAITSSVQNPNQIEWYKPASRGPYYPAGFTLSFAENNAITVDGLSLGSSPLSGLTTATLQFSGSGLMASVPAITAQIKANGVGTAKGVAGFALSISPTTGLYTGKFLDSSNVSRAFNGVLLPANGTISAHGFGLFKGNPYTGKTGSPPGDTGSVEF